jgi:hypothetical protein
LSDSFARLSHEAAKALRAGRQVNAARTHSIDILFMQPLQ